jgi:DNA-binding response OmpR family regulator
MKKILIVEDRSETRELLQVTFEENYQLLFAENGMQGLETARAGQPDLVLLDVMLAGGEMNGLEVCRCLKMDPATANMVVVFLSAKCRSEDVAAGLACGANDYITKPFSPIELMGKIAAWLADGHPGFSYGRGGGLPPLFRAGSCLEIGI